jgi:hypothetical protein
MQINVLTTENESWGFFGTVGNHADAPKAWALAFGAVARATGCSPEGVCDFLDSRHGRHFADDVANGLARGEGLEGAVVLVIELWQKWLLSRRLHKETGILAGLPYLTGWAAHFEICGDLAG